MAFQPSSPHRKRRWLALLAIVMLGTGLTATSVAAAVPSFTIDDDDDGANDEPGQKDLTGQATAIDAGTNDFYSTWLWDDTSWSGKNTGDACSLFDTDGDGLTNYAVCVTVATKNATETSERVYSCTDGRSDRCTGPTLLSTAGVGGAPDACFVQSATGVFDSPALDTQAICNISDIDDFLTNVSGLDGANLLNSCSYPSQEPNSDPSDCVKIITNANTSVGTLSSGSATWTATLNDTATLTPLTATGSVVFKLWTTSSCNDVTPVWESAAVALASGTASTVGAGTTSGTNVITESTVDADGVYYWTVDYTPSGAFNGSSSPCGEATTITQASVSGGS